MECPATNDPSEFDFALLSPTVPIPIQSRDRLPLNLVPLSVSWAPLHLINPPRYPPPNVFALLSAGDWAPMVTPVRFSAKLDPGIELTEIIDDW